MRLLVCLVALLLAAPAPDAVAQPVQIIIAQPAEATTMTPASRAARIAVIIVWENPAPPKLQLMIWAPFETA